MLEHPSTTRVHPRLQRKIDAVYPLGEFSQDMQDRIAAQVAAPQPPARWIAIGAADDPKPLAWLPSRGWYEWHWQRGIDPEAKRTPIPPYLRAQVIARDGHVCQLCGGDIEVGDLHVDHIYPFSKGGETVLSNLQASHSVCNMRKGAMVYAEDQDDQA